MEHEAYLTTVAQVIPVFLLVGFVELRFARTFLSEFRRNPSTEQRSSVNSRARWRRAIWRLPLLHDFLGWVIRLAGWTIKGLAYGLLIGGPVVALLAEMVVLNLLKTGEAPDAAMAFVDVGLSLSFAFVALPLLTINWRAMAPLRSEIRDLNSQVRESRLELRRLKSELRSSRDETVESSEDRGRRAQTPSGASSQRPTV